MLLLLLLAAAAAAVVVVVVAAAAAAFPGCARQLQNVHGLAEYGRVQAPAGVRDGVRLSASRTRPRLLLPRNVSDRFVQQQQNLKSIQTKPNQLTQAKSHQITPNHIEPYQTISNSIIYVCILQ